MNRLKYYDIINHKEKEDRTFLGVYVMDEASLILVGRAGCWAYYKNLNILTNSYNIITCETPKSTLSRYYNKEEVKFILNLLENYLASQERLNES